MRCYAPLSFQPPPPMPGPRGGQGHSCAYASRHVTRIDKQTGAPLRQTGDVRRGCTAARPLGRWLRLGVSNRIAHCVCLLLGCSAFRSSARILRMPRMVRSRCSRARGSIRTLLRGIEVDDFPRCGLLGGRLATRGSSLVFRRLQPLPLGAGQETPTGAPPPPHGVTMARIMQIRLSSPPVACPRLQASPRLPAPQDPVVLLGIHVYGLLVHHVRG